MSTLQALRQSLWPKIAGFVFFLGVLADILGVTQHLEASSKTVAAFVPLVAWAGTASFGIFLAERLWWSIRDRRDRGPARRDFMCLHCTILQRKKSLLKLPDRIRSTIPDQFVVFTDRPDKRAAINSQVRTEMETLASSLKVLDI